MAIVTIKDIAIKSGASITTVSRVINGNYPVSEEVKKRVREVMKELDYHPNAVARSLRSKKSNLIGFIIADLSNQFFMEVAKGLEKEVESVGYQLLISSSDNNPDKETLIINSLIERNIDGLVIASSGGKSIDAIKKCIDLNIPVVLIDRAFPELDTVQLLWDDYDTSYNLTKYLIENGHRDIAIVNVKLSNPTGQDRLNGYLKALSDNGIDKNDAFISGSNFDSGEAYIFIKNLFSQDKRPTAVYCCNNKMADGALEAFNELGLVIGRDVSVVAFGNMRCNRYLPVKITHAFQNANQMGEISGRRILSSIKGEEIEENIEIIRTEFCHYDSVRRI